MQPEAAVCVLSPCKAFFPPPTEAETIVTSTKTIAAIFMGLTLAACGGKAAMEDLSKLKDKTCGCAKDDTACIDEAKKMAAEWKKKHANARGVDEEKLQATVTELTSCNMGVAMALISD